MFRNAIGKKGSEIKSIMKIYLLKNKIQKYAWGSKHAIPELIGKMPDGSPQAELWMGAHPKAPSLILKDGRYLSLADLINKSPREFLGEKTAEKFKNQLPYLFKVLAAAKPLSIQAHPSKEQAVKGFEKETNLKIPLDAPNRNYKDPNHKPECILALTPFSAMCGFRPVEKIIGLFSEICPASLEKDIGVLKRSPDSAGLKFFFKNIISLKEDKKKRAIDEALANSHKFSNKNPAYKWIIKLCKAYPEDIGILSPLFLNFICLEPDQALFLPACTLHSYLDGTGIEIMANSDNVLRGGLTPKHVDIPELMDVLDFEPKEIKIINPVKISQIEWLYPCKTEEFRLSRLTIENSAKKIKIKGEKPEILICTKGQVCVTESGKEIRISKGTSIFICGSVKEYGLTGRGKLYRASVPF